MVLKSEVIGTCVISKQYGKGTIEDIRKEKDNYFVAVQYNSKKIEYDLCTVLRKGILSFEEEQKKKLSALCSNPEEKISELINKIHLNQPVVLDLIKLYGNKDFEIELKKIGAEKLARKLDNIFLKQTDEDCILLLFIFIALCEYDGNLHEKIIAVFNDQYHNVKSYKDTQISEAIRSILKKYRNNIEYTFDKKSYVAVPLVLACISHRNMKDLFQIADYIFSKRLSYDYEASAKDIQEAIEATLATLKKRIDRNSPNRQQTDESFLDGTNYKLSSYTQFCISSGYNIDALSSVLEQCIHLIINYYLNQTEDAFTTNLFYLQGFELWKQTVEQEKKNINVRKRVIIQGCKLSLDYSKNIILTTSPFITDKINPEHDSVKIVVSNGNYQQYIDLNDIGDIEYYSDELFIGYKINSKKIKLEFSPLGNMSYRIEYGRSVIYYSEDKLIRDILFFDSYGEEIKPGIDEYKGRIQIITHTNKDDLSDSIFQKEATLKDCELYVGEVNSKTTYHLGDNSFSFNKIEKPVLCGNCIPWAEVMIPSNRKNLPIYRYVSIMIKTSSKKADIGIENYGKEIEGKNYNIYFVSYSLDRQNIYMINFVKLAGVLFSLRIYDRTTNKDITKGKLEFVFDSSISKKFKRKDNISNIYVIKSDFIDSKEIVFPYGALCKEIPLLIKGYEPMQLNIFPISYSVSCNRIEWYSIAEGIPMYSTTFSQTDTVSQTDVFYIRGPQIENIIITEIDGERQENNQTLSFDTLNKEHFGYKVTCNIPKMNRAIRNAEIEIISEEKKFTTKVWYVPKVEIKYEYNIQHDIHHFNVEFHGRDIWMEIICNEIVLFNNRISCNEKISIEGSATKGIKGKVLKISFYRIYLGRRLEKPFLEKKQCIDLVYGDGMNYADIRGGVSEYKFFFHCSEKLQLRIYPETDNNNYRKFCVFKKNITSGESFKVQFPPFFMSYRLFFDLTGTDYNEPTEIGHMHVSPPITNLRGSSFFGIPHEIKKYVFDDLSESISSLSIRFRGIDNYDISKGISLRGDLINKKGEIKVRDIIAHMIKCDEGSCTFSLLQEDRNNFKSLYLKQKKIIKIII